MLRLRAECNGDVEVVIHELLTRVYTGLVALESLPEMEHRVGGCVEAIGGLLEASMDGRLRKAELAMLEELATLEAMGVG